MNGETIRTCGYCNQALPRFARICPRCEHDVGVSTIDEPSKATLLEQIGESLPRDGGRSRNDGLVVPFRPVTRLRRAMLCVIDDGLDDGEWVRIRTDKITVGRTEGDVLVPDDPKISSRHAEVARKTLGGYSRWFLRDLKSTNGTFVKVGAAKLVNGSEIMIGLRRFVFKLPELAESNEPQEQRKVTQGWAVGPALKPVFPSLVELENESPLAFSFVKASASIGSGGSCDMRITDDPTVEAVHAEVAMDRNGHWNVKAAPSMNGTWFRIEEVRVDQGCLFQAGEQRFKLRVQ